MNDGITSSLILFSSVFILILSYLIYKDTINILQGAGLSVLLFGVLVISLFKAPELTENAKEFTSVID
jgi:drug/metabolite transporter (DMT)-like permease